MLKFNITLEIPEGNECKGCKFRYEWVAEDWYYSGSACGLFNETILGGEKIEICKTIKICNGKLYPPSKPSWNLAPEWANWLAMSSTGLWYWFDREPEPHEVDDDFDYVKEVPIEKGEFFLNNWKTMKEERPSNKRGY